MAESTSSNSSGSSTTTPPWRAQGSGPPASITESATAGSGSNDSDEANLPEWKLKLQSFQKSQSTTNITKSPSTKVDEKQEGEVPEWKVKYQSMKKAHTAESLDEKFRKGDDKIKAKEGESVPEWKRKFNEMKLAHSDSETSTPLNEQPGGSEALSPLDGQSHSSRSQGRSPESTPSPPPPPPPPPEEEGTFGGSIRENMEQAEEYEEQIVLEEEVEDSIPSQAASQQSETSMSVSALHQSSSSLQSKTTSSGTSRHESQQLQQSQTLEATSSASGSRKRSSSSSGQEYEEEEIIEEIVEETDDEDEEIIVEVIDELTEQIISDEVSYEEIPVTGDGPGMGVSQINAGTTLVVANNTDKTEEEQLSLIPSEASTEVQGNATSNISKEESLSTHGFASLAISPAPAPEDETNAYTIIHRPIPQVAQENQFQPRESQSSFSAFRPHPRTSITTKNGVPVPPRTPSPPDPAGEHSESTSSAQIEPEGSVAKSEKPKISEEEAKLLDLAWEAELQKDKANEAGPLVPVPQESENIIDIEHGDEWEDEPEDFAQPQKRKSRRKSGVASQTDQSYLFTRRADNPILMFLVLILFFMLVAAAVLLVLALLNLPPFERSDNDSRATPFPTPGPTSSDFVGNVPTTPMDPYISGQCPVDGQVQPNVLSQCECDGQITTLEPDVRKKYNALVSSFILRIYSSWSTPIDSCDPRNLALVWLSTSRQIDETDLLQRYVLALLYYSSEGANWISQENWLSEVDVCMWYGIACTNDLVAIVALEDNKVTGLIPWEMGLLSGIQRINFDRNSLTGTIPGEIFLLPILQEVSVSYNEIASPLPENLEAASNLESLKIDNNLFEGRISPALGGATSLRSLDLAYNYFSEDIPSELYQLTRLESLSIEGNSLVTGRIPTEFGLFTNLEFFSISNTTMRARIPREYESLTKLTDLRMANTLAGGEIPEEVGDLKDLLSIDFSESMFRRTIPTILGNFRNLTVLLLSNNGLTGEIPSELGQMTQLTTLLLDGNDLSGIVPTEMGSLTLLETLTIESNPLLTGRIPDEICDLRAYSLDTFSVDCPTRDHAPICSIPSCCTSCKNIPPAELFQR